MEVRDGDPLGIKSNSHTRLLERNFLKPAYFQADGGRNSGDDFFHILPIFLRPGCTAEKTGRIG
jgi:hypothetical protein